MLLVAIIFIKKILSLWKIGANEAVPFGMGRDTKNFLKSIELVTSVLTIKINLSLNISTFPLMRLLNMSH